MQAKYLAPLNSPSGRLKSYCGKGCGSC